MPLAATPDGAKQVFGKYQSFRALVPTQYEQEYLYGVRGVLLIETFLWMFLETFVPVAVAASNDTQGRLYQRMLRKTLSVIFWNQNLLYGSMVFLSARCIAIPFLRKPCKEQVARSVMTRGITLWFPVAFGLAIVKLAFTGMGLDYVYEFKQRTQNLSMAVPYRIPNAFAFFNSVFNMFWTTRNFDIQAASTAFPTQTLWIINAVYSQSYTVYMTMVIIPYTRKKWRVQAAIVFVLAAWWVQSWAWFTITGLLIGDMVMNMQFKAKAQQGIPLTLPFGAFRKPDGNPRRIPVWIPAVFCMGAGLLMQFLWTAWRPDLLNKEYYIHTNIYLTGGLNVNYQESHTHARADNYLCLVGFFLLLETYDIAQRVFSNGFLKFFGKRSLSKSFSAHAMLFALTVLSPVTPHLTSPRQVTSLSNPQ